MAKVYPEINISSNQRQEVARNPTILTVWNKSMLFNCDGFTVYNSSGNLLYRVDNYVRGGNGEIVLMNAPGRSLLTIRHKRLSLSDNWIVYDGETSVNPRFSVTKHHKLRNKKSLAYVSDKKNTIYEIEGSYAQKCCMVYDNMHRCVAEIKRKEAKRSVNLGRDVFDLVVQQPLMDPTVAMALVIVLDQMFGSSS